jgi:hypothetical protein
METICIQQERGLEVVKGRGRREEVGEQREETKN